MRFIYTFLFLGTFFYTQAQRCITTDPASSLLRKGSDTDDSHYKGSRDTLSNEIITIPVVVHVLYNDGIQNISDAQILSQIESLNNDYRRRNADTINTPDVFKQVAADTRISFCLAKVDPEGRPTTGIIRKYTTVKQFLADDAVKFSSKGGSDAWDASKYMNIWVCNLFGRTLGYAVLPGGPAERDGVVIKYSAFGTKGTLSSPYNKGRTATHEIGHWLGLQHLWGSDVCGDDGIDDTPQQQAANTGCVSFPRVSTCSIDQNGDMFMNYMDFTNDACMNLFTNGQKNAMRSLFAKGGARNSLLSSTVCDGTTPEAAPLPDIQDSALSVDLRIFPNPFTDNIVVTALSEIELKGKALKIYNTTGKLYGSYTLNAQKSTISLGHLPSGIYFVRIEGNDKPFISRLIKVAR